VGGIEDLNNKELEIEYYVVNFIFSENENYYTLWYTSDSDGFVLADNQTKIKSFQNEKAAKMFANERKLNLIDEKTDIICNESKLLYSQEMSYNMLLSFWNIISDVSNSLKLDFYGDCEENTFIYNKIFYSCNLPSIKKEGNSYYPKWSRKEKDLIEEIINEGIKILSEALNRKR